MSTLESSSQTAFIRDESRHIVCGSMSASRRTFCLIVAFDLIMTFILWGVYIKVVFTDWKMTIWREVCQFTFSTSLFDVVLCAGFRFLILIFAYAAIRIRNPSAIAVSTFVTCVFLVVKLFLLKNDLSVMAYIPLITSFIIVWVETWFLDFKVLPQEQCFREAWAVKRSLEEREEERRVLLEEDEQQYHTPDDSSPVVTSHTHSPRSYGTMPPQLVSEFRQMAEDAWRHVHRLFMVDDDWKLERDVDDISVYSQYADNLGKVLKLETYIDASPTRVFEESVMNCASISSWNPTILNYRVLQVIDTCTDIAYNVTAPAAGGVVSSRDFVTLRHWKISEDQVILSSGIAVPHPAMPPSSEHVRGENRLAGWEFRPVANISNRCFLRMIVSTDIKGWIPQRIVNEALTGVLLDFIRHLRKHAVAVASV